MVEKQISDFFRYLFEINTQECFQETYKQKLGYLELYKHRIQEFEYLENIRVEVWTIWISD